MRDQIGNSDRQVRRDALDVTLVADETYEKLGARARPLEEAFGDAVFDRHGREGQLGLYAICGQRQSERPAQTLSRSFARTDDHRQVASR